MQLILSNWAISFNNLVANELINLQLRDNNNNRRAQVCSESGSNPHSNDEAATASEYM